MGGEFYSLIPFYRFGGRRVSFFRQSFGRYNTNTWKFIWKSDPVLNATKPIMVWDEHPGNNPYIFPWVVQTDVRLYRIGDLVRTYEALLRLAEAKKSQD